jgi:hypothetical protein
MDSEIQLTVVTKPWPDKPIEALAQFVRKLGCNGIELPVRPGLPVTPENAPRDLPIATRVFENEGLRLASVAGPGDERMVAACGDSGIPVLRLMAKIDPGIGYSRSVAQVRRAGTRLMPSPRSTA